MATASSLFPKLFGQNGADGADATSPAVADDEVSDATARLVRSRDPDNNQDHCLILSDLVTDLGPLLTHSSPGRRQTALSFVTRVLAGLPADFFRADEISFLARFLLDRLKDASIMYSSVIQGCHALFLSPSLPDDALELILTAVFNDVQPPSLTVQDRSLVFDLLSHALSTHAQRLTSSPGLSSTFVVGFLQAAEGETNPRLLRLLFSCWPRVIALFDVGVYAEDVFDALACYFPIDFSQPKGGGYQVTKADLADGLHRSLTCTPLFAPFALPLFLEKLGSDLVDAKIDALDCLNRCLSVYSAEDLQPHLRDVWNHCKQEIMGIRANTSREVVREAHGLLGALTRTLGSVAEPQDALKEWIDLVWGELKNFLKFLESSLMETAVGILAQVAKQNERASRTLVDNGIVVLLEMLDKSEEKGRVAEMLHVLLSGGFRRQTRPDWTVDLLDACRMAVADSADAALRNFGVRCAMVYADKIYDGEEACRDWLAECFEKSAADESVLSAPVHAELTLALHKPIGGGETVVLDWCRSLIGQSEWPASRRTARVLGLLCQRDPAVLELMLPEMLDKLHGDAFFDLLPELEGVCAKLPDRLDYIAGKQKLLERVLDAAGRDEAIDLTPAHEPISRIVAGLHSETHLPAVEDLTSRFLKQIKSKDAESPMAMLTKTAMLSVHPAPLEKLPNLGEFFDDDASLTNGSLALAQVRASILNKCAPRAETDRFLERVLASSSRMLHLPWIVKGLLMRGHKSAKTLLEKLLRQLREDDETRSEYLVIFEDDEALSAERRHHRCFPFYKQKTFLSTFPGLMSWYRDEKDLRVLDLLLRQFPHLPPSVVESEVSPLVPEIAAALFRKVEEPRMSPAVCSFLAFLRRMGKGDGSKLAELAETVLPFLLRAARCEAAGVEDRVRALEAVEAAAAGQGGDAGVSQSCKDVRALVVRETDALRNDNKRLVRRAAVEARNVWMLIA